MAYAIIKTGGRQFRVAEGDTIDVDLLDVDPGKTATFGEVLRGIKPSSGLSTINSQPTTFCNGS